MASGSPGDEFSRRGSLCAVASRRTGPWMRGTRNLIERVETRTLADQRHALADRDTTQQITRPAAASPPPPELSRAARASGRSSPRC